MKKTAILLTLLIASLPLFAGEPYFCNRSGAKLHYERYKVKNHKLIQTTLFEIESCTSTRINYAVTMKKANGDDIFGGRAAQKVEIAPNGDVRLNYGETVMGFIRNMFPNLKLEATEAIALLPANMQPGDTLPESHCTVKAIGFPAYFHVSDRVVVRKERVTTPAGTFDCVVVREHEEQDAPFHHPDTWLENYYVPGLGYVRHDRFDKKMRLEESEVLVKIEE